MADTDAAGSAKPSRWFAIPFGRTVDAEQDIDKAAQVFVGRRKEREFFINALLRGSRRGAYLVTGNRGVGKTSFVDYCLAAYEREVYERHVRAATGRHLFWDAFVLLGLAWFVAFIALCLSDLLGMVLRAVFDTSSDTAPGHAKVLLHVLLAVPPVLLFSLPCLYAIITFKTLNRFAHVCVPQGVFMEWWWWRHVIPQALVLIVLLVLLVQQLYAVSASVTALTMLTFGLAATLLVQASTATTGRWYVIGCCCLLVGVLACVAWVAWIGSYHVQEYFPDRLGWLVGSVAVLLGYTAAALLRRENVNGRPPGRNQSVSDVAIRALVITWVKIAVSFAVSGQLVVRAFQSAGWAQWGQSAPSPHEDLVGWTLAMIVLLAVIFYYEYHWVLQARRLHRREGIDRNTVADPCAAKAAASSDPGCNSTEAGAAEAALAETTLPLILFREWLPVLRVPISLGVQRLEHRHIVQTMLLGLQRAYGDAFVGAMSVSSLLRHSILIALALFAVHLLDSNKLGSTRLVKPRLSPAATPVGEPGSSGTVAPDGSSRSDDDAAGKVAPSCDAIVPMGSVLSDLPKGPEVVSILGKPLFSIGPTMTGAEPVPLFPVLHLLLPQPSDDCVAAAGAAAAPVRRIFVRVYHPLLLLLVLLGLRRINTAMGLLPYRRNLAEMGHAVEDLVAKRGRRHVESSFRPWVWLGPQVSSQVDAEPADSRVIEQRFLELLGRLQAPAVRMPLGSAVHRISIPVPEIVFVFDELDKLGAASDGNHASTATGASEGSESARIGELYRLFGDMKNILSSAPARFIFIGGRALYDEWLADQSANQPLLSNVFLANTYLPSLLTDIPEGGSPSSSRGIPSSHRTGLKNRMTWEPSVWRIAHYIGVQQRRGFEYQRSLHGRRTSGPLSSRFLPREGPRVFFASEADDPCLTSFGVTPVDGASTAAAKSASGTTQRVFQFDAESEGDQYSSADESKTECITRDLVEALAYRSLGNPKRLGEMLRGLIAPLSFAEPMVRRGDDAIPISRWLCLRAASLARIQFLASVYRQVGTVIRIAHNTQDDKPLLSLLYVTDFLFKFHRRAFSWGSLDRVDALVDVHRSPELRRLIEATVEGLLGRALHPIRNGMYDFRFRSEVAAEINYLSRQVPEEMAALNFTLDESRVLRRFYEDQRVAARERQGTAPWERAAALADILGFEESHEAAALHYREALRTLDAGAVVPHVGALAEAQGVIGGDVLAWRVTEWAVSRLRLLLEIGMSYEQARRWEQAVVAYHEADMLSWSLLVTLLDEPGRRQARLLGLSQARDRVSAPHLHLMKYLSILFQASFASAWLAEKQAGNVDTSISLIEKELERLREVLPFVREHVHERPTADCSPANVQHSNFSLAMADLHNKAGDLCFYKGADAHWRVQREENAGRLSFESRCYPKVAAPQGVGAVSRPSSGQAASQPAPEVLDDPSDRMEGYLLRAYYHYAMALHELRRHTWHRRETSDAKFNIWANPRWATLGATNWPVYTLRAAAGTMGDLAESMLGRVSLWGLQDGVDASGRDVQSEQNKMQDMIQQDVESWLVSSDADVQGVSRSLTINCSGNWELGSIGGWLGRWQCPPLRPGWLLVFGEKDSHGPWSRLLMALHFTRVGARFFRYAGYNEEAAREALKVADTTATYLWWAYLLETVLKVEIIDNDAVTPERPQTRRPKRLWLQWGLSRAKKQYLWELGRAALDDAAESAQRGARDRGEQPGGASWEGCEALGLAVTVAACALALAKIATDAATDGVGDSSAELEGCWAHVERLYRWGVSGDAKKHRLGAPERWLAVLADVVEVVRYPTLIRLAAWRTLAEYQCVANLKHKNAPGKPPFDPKVVGRFCEDLLGEAEQFGAPMHFTPLRTGMVAALAGMMLQGQSNKTVSVTMNGTTPVQPPVTRAIDEGSSRLLWWMRGAGKFSKQRETVTEATANAGVGEIAPARTADAGVATDGDGAAADYAKAAEEFFEKATVALKRSRAMYQQGRAYYESIASLYYLYDDFNDRQMHYNHAMQMAAAELSGLLLLRCKAASGRPVATPAVSLTAKPTSAVRDAAEADDDAHGVVGPAY